MSFVRAASFTTALMFTACGSTVAEPPPAAAGDAAFAEPPPAGDVAFAAPRPADRAADPMGPAPAAGVEVRLGAPFTPVPEGPWALPEGDHSGVLAELQHNAGHLERCWQSRASEARAGSIVIHAHIGADGLVTGQCVTEDTVGDRELLQCANDLIAMGRYPKLGDEPVDVVIPLHFGGGEG
jgi:hypothetical protein